MTISFVVVIAVVKISIRIAYGSDDREAMQIVKNLGGISIRIAYGSDDGII